MVRKRIKIKLRYKKERVLFSDILPYEVPLIFTNRYFYRFLVRNQINIDEDNKISINKTSKAAEQIINIICKNKKDTIPFQYKILHKPNKCRELSIIHPFNQIKVVSFYEKYKSLILYFCGLSNFSLRHPSNVACYFYYKDNLHNALLGNKNDKLELFFNEYENLKTYFGYNKYANIYKFYEDYRYQRAEKKYAHLLKFDLQSCFDSIYTHSIAWATNGGKENYKRSKFDKKAFGYKFDELMQRMNYNETNGIVIGPEFSRIFAEIILGYIDKTVEIRAFEKEYVLKREYECYRYVDDYFLFYNEEKVKDDIMILFSNLLKEFKLTISSEKTIEYERPFITPITRAKDKITQLIDDTLSKRTFESRTSLNIRGNESDDEEKDNVQLIDDELNWPYEKERLQESLEHRNYISLCSNLFNSKFKTIIVDCGVEYRDILNYSFSVINTRTISLLRSFDKDFKLFSISIGNDKVDNEMRLKCKKKKEEQEKMIAKYFVELLDSIFFLYANSKRIGTTIKVISILNLLINYLKNDYEFKGTRYRRFLNSSRDLVFKKIKDEISLIMQTAPFNEDTQLETLYLFIELKELGTNYLLSPQEIKNFFGMENEYPSLNFLAFSILLYYYGNHKKYEDLKKRLFKKIKEYFKCVPASERNKRADLSIFWIDLCTCPYLEDNQKKKILELMGIEEKDCILAYLKKRKFMFVRWTGVNVNKELGAKISQNVYS